MKTTHFNKLHPVLARGVVSSLSLVLLFSLSSCNKEDPSYEKEALRLTAEKASLEAQLEESEQKLTAMQTKLNQAQLAVNNANEMITASKGQIDAAKGQIDAEKIKLGFAKAVSGLGAQIEEKHPDYTVESVTFQKMKMPTDYPFSSGVMTTLVSKSTGEKQNLYWEAQGNTQGNWRFANKKKPTTAVASTPAATPAPGVATNPPSTVPATPARPTPARPARPTRLPAGGANANSHIIDWGKLK